MVGVDDYWGKQFGSEGIDLQKAIKNINKENLTIIMSHQPVAFSMIFNQPVDIMFSGHTHGGQVTLPGDIGKKLNFIKIISSYVTGLYEEHEKILYVNRGLGTAGPPLRLGSKPEIAFFKIKHSENSIFAKKISKKVQK